MVDKWFLNDCVVKIDGVGCCMDEKMECVARGFCKSSKGVFVACIGAFDGWLVAIKKASVKSDCFQNPVSYYSREGFYGVNVQVIVSHDKIILFHKLCIVAQMMTQLHSKMVPLGKGYTRTGNYLILKYFIF